MIPLSDDAIFAFYRPMVDAHNLGIALISQVLRDCGYRVVNIPDRIRTAMDSIREPDNMAVFRQWLEASHVSVLGFSYRLDPADAERLFGQLYYALRDNSILAENGGQIHRVCFAGLPESCRRVQAKINAEMPVFCGDETPVETLRMLGVPEIRIPHQMIRSNQYDEMRMQFAEQLIASKAPDKVLPPDHGGYPEYGTARDTYTARLRYCREHNSLPIIRTHCGPYNPVREEAIAEYISWCKELAASGLLDVLSIGASQLTQSNFGESWEGLSNGGGVPVNSEAEYQRIWEAARPMLVRTYCGSKNIPQMALMHERSLNISWHAFSFWWFCELDGRGKNSLLQNLNEYFEAMQLVAPTGKPVEPNVSHHFAFRSSDDATYIISAYLAIQSIKRSGVRHAILPIMLNTPKQTWGVQDLAKAKVLLRLVRPLEDDHFRVSLQTRAGLDYFSPDLDKARKQLAAVTAMMDDIEPTNHNSPQIIHVVNYSEAVSLATPAIVNESIRITLASLHSWRDLRSSGKNDDINQDTDLKNRTEDLYDEVRDGIDYLENRYSDLYTPYRFYKLFDRGYLPVPYLMNAAEYPKAVQWKTALRDGGMKVVDDSGNTLRTVDRYRQIQED